MITNKIIAAKLLSFLQSQASIAGIVAWAEQELLEGDYKYDPAHTVRNILAQLGSADIKAFGLEWKDLVISWK